MIQKSLKLESDTESLLHEIANRHLQVGKFEKQVRFLDEKEQLYISSMDREKSLEEQKSHVQGSLAATECQLTEAKILYDLMVGGKQIELSKNLRELSLRNDQVLIRSQAENELKERLSSLRQEHEAQMNLRNIQHEEDRQKLQDELELQKSKEEKQRALLQLQWKVMGENQQVDQEVSSKKRRDSYVRKESQVQLAGPETKRKEPNTQKPLHNTAEKDVTRTRKVVPGSCPILQTFLRAP